MVLTGFRRRHKGFCLPLKHEEVPVADEHQDKVILHRIGELDLLNRFALFEARHVPAHVDDFAFLAVVAVPKDDSVVNGSCNHGVIERDVKTGHISLVARSELAPLYHLGSFEAARSDVSAVARR